MLAEGRKEFEPNPDNPSGPPVPRRPDWNKVIQTTSDWLAGSSKDLRVAVHLVEALTRSQGFAGLRDGLILLQRLFTDCWDRMYPVVEDDGDLETRAGNILWLNNPEGGALFPNTIRALPLLRLNKVVVSCLDWQASKVGETPLDRAGLPGAQLLQAESPQWIAECVAELGILEQVLSDKLQHHAPVLISIRQALEECQRLVAQVAAAPTSPAAPAAPPGVSASAPVAPSNPNLLKGLDSRAEIYEQLTVLAHRLAALEPHSPIPDLLLWAVELGKMPFRQLIKEVVREQGVLAEICRNFGIREETGNGAS
jgi:type VI secretion system protein ImpA